MEYQYYKRNIDGFLLAWSKENPPDRKPLLLRGARQVGKSSALRQLGKKFRYFLEINFEENKEVKSFFERSLSPQEICEQLALYYKTPIVPGETLLFLDEIQSCKPKPCFFLMKSKAALLLWKSSDIFMKNTQSFT